MVPPPNLPSLKKTLRQFAWAQSLQTDFNSGLQLQPQPKLFVLLGVGFYFDKIINQLVLVLRL